MHTELFSPTHCLTKTYCWKCAAHIERKCTDCGDEDVFWERQRVAHIAFLEWRRSKPKRVAKDRSERLKNKVRPWMHAAHRLVKMAVNRGLLPDVKTQTCVDCGKQARVHEHRFYTRPLDVEPVCLGCNQARGVAWDDELLQAEYK